MLVPVADVLDRAVRVAGTAPWLAIGVLAGVTGGLAVFVGLVRRRHATVGEEFLDRLRDCDRVTVLTHPNPDPDALGAGLALVHLADAVGVESTLQYPGEIRHQENRAFRTVLSVDCERVEHVSDLAAEAVVLVDHNEPRGFAGAGSVLPYAVLDHHPGDGEGSAFTDVRTDYGATASLVAEYLEGLGAVPVPSDSHATEIDAELTVPSTVATALMYGILTDTDDLTSGATAADFAAAGYLRPGIDETQLERVANPQVSAGVLETRARAIVDREVRGSFAVSYVADAANSDAVPQAVDELIQLEGVTAAVVCGECDGTVYLSGRSRDQRVHMGRTLEAVTDCYHGASAGGHARMGGGQVDEREMDRWTLVERAFDALDGAATPTASAVTPPDSGTGPDSGRDSDTDTVGA